MAFDDTHQPLPPTGSNPQSASVKALFPKIGRPRDALDTLRYHRPHLFECKATLSVHGTVKLHGQHADVLFQANGDTIRYQSRTVDDLVAQRVDINDFAKTMSQPDQIAALLEIRDRIKARFIDRQGDFATQGAKPLTTDSKTEIVLQGEWIGKGIQKGVAVSSLTPCWVIYGILINGHNENFRNYSDIECPYLEIFNIHRAPRIEREFRLGAVAWSLEQLQLATDEVIKQCPFGASRGIKGKGEGIVWKITWMEGNNMKGLDNPRLWFKMKGRMDGNKKLAACIMDLEKKDSTKRAAYERLAEEYVTVERVEKALQYVQMECKSTSRQDAAQKVEDWIARDIMVEEAKDLADLGYGEDPEVEKEVRMWARCHVERINLGPWTVQRVAHNYKERGNSGTW